MKWLLGILVVFLILGCQSTTVIKKQPFPEASLEQMKICDDLIKFTRNEDNTVNLINLQEVVANNYIKYEKCAEKNNTWISWYKLQKKNYEDNK